MKKRANEDEGKEDAVKKGQMNAKCTTLGARILKSAL